MSKKRNLKGLYAITDSEPMTTELIAKITQAILGGIKILQYRNKAAGSEQQEQDAHTLAKLCKNHNIIFIINDNVELALKVDADGVHLGQKDTNIKQARELLGENKIIGVSCNNKIEAALTAQQQGADYVAFGRFFTSATKPSAPQAKLSLLSEAKQLISIPIVAIGGITPEVAPQLLKQGADMLAVVQGIFAQEDILTTTHKFVEIFNTMDSPKASG